MSNGCAHRAATLEGLSRRHLLAAATTGLLLSPIGSQGLLAKSAVVLIYAWSGYFSNKLLARFKAETGITPIYIPFETNAELRATLTANQGRGFDVIMTTLDHLANYVEADLVQPINESRVNLGAILSSPKASTAGHPGLGNGTRYMIPTHWGTEAILFDRKKAPVHYGISFGDLWSDHFAGHLTIRIYSALAGLGRCLEARGTLPHPFCDGFTNPDVMDDNWNAILKYAIPRKHVVNAYWTGATDAAAAYLEKGSTIGQNRAETAANLVNAGLDVGYVAPIEGAFAWLKGFCLPKHASNIDEAYVWMNWFLNPKVGAISATDRNANSVARNAEKYLRQDSRWFYAEAFPGDALDRLWWWPAQATWYVAKRTEFVNRFLAA